VEAVTITLILNGESVEMAGREGETILESAQRSGHAVPHSCQIGACASCIARLLEGDIVMRANHVLSPAEVEEGLVLTCQGVPVTSRVTVQYE